MGGGTSTPRKYPRYLTSIDVVVSNSDESVQARITQLSRGGCLVMPPLQFLQGASLRLSFRVALDSPIIHCKGEIAYSISDRGTGIAFTEISRYNQDLITRQFEPLPAAGQSQSA